MARLIGGAFEKFLRFVARDTFPIKVVLLILLFNNDPICGHISMISWSRCLKDSFVWTKLEPKPWAASDNRHFNTGHARLRLKIHLRASPATVDTIYTIYTRIRL